MCKTPVRLCISLFGGSNSIVPLNNPSVGKFSQVLLAPVSTKSLNSSGAARTFKFVSPSIFEVSTRHRWPSELSLAHNMTISTGMDDLPSIFTTSPEQISCALLLSSTTDLPSGPTRSIDTMRLLSLLSTACLRKSSRPSKMLSPNIMTTRDITTGHGDIGVVNTAGAYVPITIRVEISRKYTLSRRRS